MSSPAPALQAPPQTWETSGNGNNAEAGPSHTTAHDQTNGNTTTMTTDRPPDLPERPGDMGANVNGYNPNNSMAAPSSYASRMNPMSSGYGGGYGGASYGGYGGGLSGGMYGGGYGAGGYGGGYGGSPYSRMGGAYGGGYGNGYSPYNNDPYNQPPTLSHQIQNSTAPAFAVMESLVGAFTSLAQLFESTYIATHSSFFAMVGVADQLGGLKTYLAQVLGVFSVLRLGKRIVAWIKGDRSAFSSSSSNPGNWAEEWNWKIGRAAGGPKDQGLSPPNGPTGSKRPSSKPLILFLLSSIGLPWLMSKLIKLLTRLQEEKQRAALGLAPGTMLDATGRPINVNSNPNAVGGKAQGQPGTITFARALFPFEPTAGHELALKRDEIVAVMQRFEEGASSGGKELGWWRGRTRDGRTGWFPGNYVEILRRKETTTKTDPNVDPGRMSSAPASVA